MTAVLFDVDDTLYDRKVPFVKAYKEIFGGRYQVPAERLYESNSRHSDEVFELSSTGVMSMRDMYIYRIQKAFADFAISIGEAEALAFQEAYAKHQRKLDLAEGMREVLSLCRDRGITMGIITNGPSAHQWEKIKTLGADAWIPKENIFISGDIGAAKPDVSVFQLAEKSMGLSGEAVYFIGDSYKNDVEGAKKAGWIPIWLNRRGWKCEGREAASYVAESGNDLYCLLNTILP
ncbi:HAD family hydrolase [Lactonifactor longoviformis]|uniref:HAD family hydrolase n=1 Tax=Lactonifactor longoviformis TaxID=341220 RepID=UPI0036F3EC05